jgi:hypothetical protein
MKYNYWHKKDPDLYNSPDAYASGGLKLKNTEEYGWAHPIDTVVNALVEADLIIQSLIEYPMSVDKDQFKFMVKGTDDYWRLEGNPIPLMYSIKAKKPI